jgi:hypothetical protein
MILVDGETALEAATQAFAILVEDHPDETTCETCESVTLGDVEVWPYDESGVRKFERTSLIAEVARGD